MVSITTIYPGGSPDEMEQLVSIPIEKKLREVDGLDKVRSYNIENVSVIAIYLEDRIKNKKAVIQDIKDKVEAVTNLPEKAEKPVVEEIKLDKTEVIYAAIYSKDNNKATYKELRQVADELEDYIYDIDGVAEVQPFGFLEREYLIEANPFALKNYHLDLNTLIYTVSNRNYDMPGGSLKIDKNEYVLRTKGLYQNTKEIQDTVIRANDLAFTTRIKDLARVSDTFEERKIYERFKGKEAIIFSIWKKKVQMRLAHLNALKKKFRNLIII